MLTIVDSLTFLSRINFILSTVEHEKSFKISGPGNSMAKISECALNYLKRVEGHKTHHDTATIS